MKEVAHDFQPQIRKYLENDLHCLNSFMARYMYTICSRVSKLMCRYIHVHVHVYTGTKNVARVMKKVSVGTVAARNKTWFPELSDKSKSNTCRYYVIMYMCFYKYFACT